MTSFPQALADRAAPGASLKRVPRYWRVYEVIRRRIEDHEYAVGSFLPPEAELCALLAVSRTTVRKAVELLVDDGFLMVRRGRGTENPRLPCHPEAAVDHLVLRDPPRTGSSGRVPRAEAAARERPCAGGGGSPDGRGQPAGARPPADPGGRETHRPGGQPPRPGCRAGPGVEGSAHPVAVAVRVPRVGVRPQPRRGDRLHHRAGCHTGRGGAGCGSRRARRSSSSAASPTPTTARSSVPTCTSWRAGTSTASTPSGDPEGPR